MVDMARRLYMPALSGYAGDIATSVATKAELGITSAAEKSLAQRITKGADTVWKLADELEAKAEKARSLEDPKAQDDCFCTVVIPAMEALRAEVDALEAICADSWWPVPSYNAILYYA